MYFKLINYANDFDINASNYTLTVLRCDCLRLQCMKSVSINVKI